MDHIFVIIIIFVLSLSIVGYGVFFTNYFWKTPGLSFGYYGIVGIIVLTFISYLSNLFFSHNYIHNIALHSIGIIFFFNNINIKKNLHNLKLILIILLFLLPSIYIFKTHDDFPYYHLPYINNLIENKLIIGNGNFSLAHRTHSSIFYYMSIFYLPIFNFKFINLSYFSILLFFNFFLLKYLFDKKEIFNTSFLYFLKLLSFIFVNVVFYRLSEFGTDRVGQIFILLLVLFLLREFNKIGKSQVNINFSILILTFLITQKTYFLSYIILFLPLLYFYIINKKNILKILYNKNTIFCLFIFIFFIFKNFVNNGCLIYPLVFTCNDQILWSQSLPEIRYLNSWYELWSKAGANPNFRVENPDFYISGVNWVSNWYKNYFLFKVSDFLFGTLLISFIVLFSFFSKSKKKIYNNFKYIYIALLVLFIIWFFKHPSLRYGGYTLIALMIFLPVSDLCSKYLKTTKYKSILIYSLIILTVLIFDLRNITRVKKEIRIYNYKIINDPFLFIKNVDYEKYKTSELPLYKPKKNAMCWGTQSPCAYKENIHSKRIYFYNMYYEKRNN